MSQWEMTAKIHYQKTKVKGQAQNGPIQSWSSVQQVCLTIYQNYHLLLGEDAAL